MCLAIPGKIVDLYREQELQMGKVDFGGVAKRVCLEYIQQPALGDYVLVHVGFALAHVDEAEANLIFEFLERMQGLEELGPPPEPRASTSFADEPNQQVQATLEQPLMDGVQP